MALNKAIVKQALSGDTLILRGRPRPNGPPAERLLAISNISAPRLGNKEKPDEPFAFRARNFLRKLVVGKEVSFRPEYTVGTPGREYGSVFVGQDSVAHILVREGWARVQPRRDESNPEDIEVLTQLQNEAEKQKKGIWSEDKSEGDRVVRYSLDDDPRELLSKYKGTPLDAIIEQVRDGSTLRVLLLLPNNVQQYITLLLSGIKCPTCRQGVPGQEDAVEPFGEEAKFFTESRLLQRDVKILLEGISSNSQNFIGTVRHPAGNIAEGLVASGLAKVVSWSITMVTDGPSILRAAENQAKEKKLRLWREFVGKARLDEFDTQVLKVVSGDTIIVRDPKTGLERRLQLASIRAPKRPEQKFEKGPKEYGRDFEAKEFLRKKLIGKNVHVTIDYVKPPSDGFEERECATIKVGTLNPALALLERGLAHLIYHRKDDENRASCYDELMIAEEKAKKDQKGVHQPPEKEAPVYRISDASESLAKAKQFLPHLQRSGRVNAIVEHIANGSRYRLYIPKESCEITFVLGGIRCPRAGGKTTGQKPEAYGPEALEFVSRLAWQREVEVEIEGVDKTGGFIGTLWLNNRADNAACLLLEQGLATVHEFSASQSPYTNQLYSAERKAKAEKKNLWANYDEEEEAAAAAAAAAAASSATTEQDGDTPRTEYIDVVISEIVDGGKFYVQIINDSVRQLERLMSEFSLHHRTAVRPADFKPRQGEVVSACFTADDQWYRARVRKIFSAEGKAEVVYVDYGNSETLPLSRIRPIPQQFTQLPHQAHEAVLSFVSAPSLEKDYGIEARNRFQDLTEGKQLVANVDYREHGVMHLTLYDPARSRSADASINAEIVRDGLALVDSRVKYARRYPSTLKSLEEAMEAAKRDRLNMFEYGDITGADE
ncbi:uncharacterized protein VTP21DRAFT_2697 [Calcarisporiella thermophila]|uniref:uncharacterized protein n=1 Tax=Calcarisporiella thermophila TaxID=911321 RepID=UPI00374319D2